MKCHSLKCKWLWLYLFLSMSHSHCKLLNQLHSNDFIQPTLYTWLQVSFWIVTLKQTNATGHQISQGHILGKLVIGETAQLTLSHLKITPQDLVSILYYHESINIYNVPKHSVKLTKFSKQSLFYFSFV